MVYKLFSANLYVHYEFHTGWIDLDKIYFMVLFQLAHERPNGELYQNQRHFLTVSDLPGIHYF